MLGLLRPHPAVQRGVRLDLAEVLFGERLDPVRLDVAGDDQDGIVRRVEALVVGERILAVERLDFVLPADDGDAVGVVLIERGHHLLLQNAAGIVVDARAALFEDDIPLGRHVLLG